MNPIVMILMFLVLFAIVLIAISVGYRVVESQRKKQVSAVLDTVSGVVPGEESASILLDRSAPDPIEEFLDQANMSGRLSSLLQQSGLPWTASKFIILTLICAGAGAFLAGLFRPLGNFFLSAFVGAFLVGLLPYFHVTRKKAKRLAEIEAQFPEALDFLARSMRAGHAFSISLEMLGQESPDPLGQEFRVLFNEQNLGAPLDVALENFTNRVPLVDVRLFVSSVLLQKQTGGNLSEILIRLAYVIRERFRLKGQVKAAAAHGKLTATILSVLPIVLIIGLSFVAPDYLPSMLADPDGRIMMGAAIVAQGIGYYIMRRIVDIKV